jgi:exosortase D (VPLPA-CTERM-specific)
MEANDIKTNDFIKAGFPILMILGLIIGYWPVFQKMALRWSSGDNNYCYFIVPLFLYLCWDMRDRFQFQEFSWNSWGLIPTLLAVGLIVVGEHGSVETLLYAGIWLCVVGLILLCYGWRIRFLVFPLIILFFIVPLPPFLNRLLTFELKMAASTLSVILLRAFGVSVLQEGNIIDLGISQLQVVDACSGLRYLVPLLLLALLVGYFFSKAWWRRAILLLLVVPLSVFLNVFRIWLSGMLTINGHAEFAESLFHDFSGWLIFMIAGGLLYLSSLILKRIRPSTTYKPKIDVGDRSVGILLPAMLSVIISILFISSGWALRNIPSTQNMQQRITFDSFPMEIAGWKGKKSYLSKEILDSLWTDDYVGAAYTKKNNRNIIHVFIPFYEYQGTRHTAHAPQSCLLGGGWALLKSQERLIKMDPGRDINIMTMILKKGDARVLGSYFFLQRGRVIISPWMNKFYLMWDAIKKRRTDGALVRVEMVLAPEQSMEEAYAILEDFIARLWKIIPEYIPA